MDSLWTGCGQPMDRLWTAYGQVMDSLWTGYGQVMDSLWIACGHTDLFIINIILFMNEIKFNIDNSLNNT